MTDLEKVCDLIIGTGARHIHGPETLGLGDPRVTVQNAIFEGPAGEVIELLQQFRFPGDLPEAV